MTFEELYGVLCDRKKSLPEDSSTTELMTKGLSSILPKLNEECYEAGMALEYQNDNDLALEISQCFYYLLCLSVFIDEPLSSINLDEVSQDEALKDKHKLCKEIAHCAADICHTPCLATINQLPPLLLKALDVGGATKEQMFSSL
jgi:phosphoribosyl-ATP pyrophosphohydrolase